MNWPDRFAASRIWPWNRLHELKNLQPYQREAIWGECSRASGGAARGCSLVVIGIILGGMATILVAEFFSSMNQGVPPAVDLILSLARVGLPVLGIVAGWRLTQRAVRARIMETYRDQRFPYCLHCGYALKGLPEEQTTCPECGESVRGESAVPNA